jgi:flagellar export protein FliJ
MKAFTFRLETVLSLRAGEEKIAQENYARALQHVSRAEQELADAQADLERLHMALESNRGGRFTKNDQLISLNAIKYQQSICERDAERLEHAKQEAEHRLADLIDAKRAHEILLRLKSKQQSAHAREADCREQTAIDDMVTARHGAGQREVAA